MGNRCIYWPQSPLAGRQTRGNEMIPEFGSHDWRGRKLQEWLLLLLRYAVTREPSDRSAALAMADELDSLGGQWRPAAPRFFLKTSEEVCSAILTVSDGHIPPVLRTHLARIDDPRLRRAFQAAIGLQRRLSHRSGRRARAKRETTRNLWKGLPTKRIADTAFMTAASNSYEIPISRRFLPSRFFMAFCPSIGCGHSVRPQHPMEMVSCGAIRIPRTVSALLADQLRLAQAVTPALVSHVIADACVRLAALGRTEKVATVEPADRGRCVDRGRTCFDRA